MEARMTARPHVPQGSARRHRRALRILSVVSAAAAAMLPASCASPKEPKDDYASMKWASRVSKQIKDPYSIKSPFQNDVYHASKSVKTSGFKTGEFAGEKKGFFGSKSKFKAGTFSQADKSSSAGNKTFSGAGEKNRMSDTTFTTTQSAFGTKMSRSNGQASPFAGENFNVRGNPSALENTTNVKRPLILNDEAGYSEDQVKKLLNKS
jgi:hypothetical protein